MKEKPVHEFEGKTVQEAINQAVQKLNVKKENLKIEVLTEEEKGLFGMAGAKLAKIRVFVLTDKQK